MGADCAGAGPAARTRAALGGRGEVSAGGAPGSPGMANASTTRLPRQVGVSGPFRSLQVRSPGTRAQERGVKVASGLGRWEPEVVS